jgi:O-antigen ligase
MPIDQRQRRYRLPRLPAAVPAALQGSPALVPALVATCLFVALGASEAGFYPTTWYPAALFLLALLTVALVALNPPRAVPRPVLAALLLLVAYTAWAYLSITWAGEQGPAWEGANRTALYAIVFALFALWPFDARGATAVLGLVAIGIAGIGLVELLRADASSEPAGYFIGVRLAEPAGYINANVALWTLGLLPCLFLASRRGVPAPLRGLFLGGAGLLAALALLGQSRGWVLALPLALVLYLALVPGRVRGALTVLAVAAGGAAVSGPVLAVHDEADRRGLDGLLADATTAILTMAAALVLVGTLAALVDRRIALSERAARRGSLTFGAVLGVAGVCAAAIALAASDPAERIGDAWDEFKRGESQPEVGSSRFSGGGTHRYDIWRVAWAAFRDHPWRGLGVENFQEEYLLRRDSSEQPRYAHSLELGVLSQTGLVGGLLLAGALVAALAAAARARRSPPAERALAAVAVAIFGYWLLHASVDWFWEFPALTGVALALLAMATALGPRRMPDPRGAFDPRARDPRHARGHRQALGLRSRRALQWPAAAAAALVALLLAVSFAVPWLAERHVSRAAEIWRADPTGAFEHLDRAADLNPLSPRAQLTEATIALRLGRRGRAESAFLAALEREPDNGYALLELGMIAAERGQRPRARRLLELAHSRSPRDRLVSEVLADVRRGRRVNVDQVNRKILQRARYRVHSGL